LRVAVRARRSVVATTDQPGYARVATSSIAWYDATSRWPKPSPASTSNPSEAVKSSSLPIITSTCRASARLTSRARACPPMPFHSDSR
jgi:hypothetical protein